MSLIDDLVKLEEEAKERLCCKIELGPLNFIAEDLGYLTPGVRAMASTCGFPGMDVLEFSDYDVRCSLRSM